MKWSKWGSSLTVLLFFTACAKNETAQKNVDTLPYYREVSFTPHWLAPNDEALKDFHQIAPFELINQNGEIITEKTFEGKVYVADFFFTRCPGICPQMTDNMKILQAEFLNNDEVLLLSHSVTPKMDSVAVLKKYAEKKNVVSGKWHLVTGTQKDIYKLGRQDYFVEEDLGLQKEVDEFLHTENFVLIDQNRHIRGIYNGLNKTSIAQLIKDVNVLLKE